ncbi:hypothetical protein SAY86_025451 [Trapa natans]|uniref:Meiosis-specific protein ASY3-like coiled-coil domain-containing protein n=1 Tax=Trapa natans TaxID=22666 RepID=A0AAN7RJ20_TRANT|nr:hypothetical protein SAY86_025451 [Trapa natans]
MSEIQSFGSSCLRPSQTRKISIGVMSEQSPKQTPGPMKEQAVGVALANCHQRDSIAVDGAQVTTKMKQTEPLEQSGSPWISIKLNNEKSTTSPTACHAKGIIDEVNMGRMPDGPTGFEGRPLDRSINISHTRNSFLQPDAISGEITRGRKGETHTSRQIPRTIAQEHGVVRSNIGDKDGNAVDGKSEALRMKLWELLGTVSSPIKETHSSQTLEVGADFLQPDGVSKPADTEAVRPRQNSDTVETESEDPECAKKRPVTRSFSKRKAPTKLKQDTVQCRRPSSSRQKRGERNIFSKEGGHAGSRGAATRIRPSTSNMKKNVRNNSEIEPCKSLVQQKVYERKGHQLSNKPVQHADTNGEQFPKYQRLQENVCDPSVENPLDLQHDQDSQHTRREDSGMENYKLPVHLKRNNRQIGQATNENDISPAAQKSFSHGPNFNRGLLHDRDSNINKNRSDLRTTSIEKDLSENQAHEDISSPRLPRHEGQTEEISPASPGHQIHNLDAGDTSFKNMMDPQDVAESLTLGTRSPIASPPLGSQRKESPNQNREHGLAEPETLSSGGGIFSFGNFASKFVPRGHARGELQDSPTTTPARRMKENDVEDTSACSSSEDTGSESSEEGPQAGAFSPETGTTEKLKYVLHRSKKLRSFRGIQKGEDNPTSVSPKVTTSSTSIPKLDEQNLDEGAEEENGLSRAIEMLALALEKLKSKVKLLTSKKSSEILTSVAERIHAQLQSVESQIQTDTSKLSGLSKQKRKRLETQFQEQEEKLKMIHGNFKKEISHLLEDCRGVIQGLENNHLELKGTIDKQKASHQELLSQAQAAVVTQLNDAEKRVAAIQQSAREQLLQLKLVIAECLEGRILF